MGSCQVPSPGGVSRARPALVSSAILLGLALAGCGRDRAVPELEFEGLDDTTGLSSGPEILTAFTPIRHPNGLIQLSGALRLPDSTRVQISIYRADDSSMVSRMQVAVVAGRFETPPLLGERGPLPVARYRFVLLAHFNPAWQTPRVLNEIDHGRRLRGPGMVRGTHRETALLLEREQRL